MQSHLKQLSPAPTTEQATKNAGRTGNGGIERTRAAERTGRSAVVRASRPTPKAACSASACRRTGVSCPGTNAVTFAPEGAYGDANGQSVFTHGVEVGSARNETHDLQTATDELIASLAQGNPGLEPAVGLRPRRPSADVKVCER